MEENHEREAPLQGTPQKHPIVDRRCDARCKRCGYQCRLAWNHPGGHMSMEHKDCVEGHDWHQLIMTDPTGDPLGPCPPPRKVQPKRPVWLWQPTRSQSMRMSKARVKDEDEIRAYIESLEANNRNLRESASILKEMVDEHHA